MSNEKSLVAEARELLRTHSIVAMRVDTPYREIRPLISALCDEVDRLTVLNKTQAESIQEFQGEIRNAATLIELNQTRSALDRLRSAVSPKGSEQ